MRAPTNPPRKHHFLPEFYLKRWAGGDDRVERYSIEHGEKIHRRRVFPSEAAFEVDLNRIPGPHDDEWAAQRIETDFFAPLDSAAAVVADDMIATGTAPTTGEARTTWMTFVMSLLHRSPSNLAATLSKVAELNNDLMPDVEARYAEIKGLNDPPTFEEWERTRAPHEMNKSGLRAMMDVVANPRAGGAMINLDWQVIDLCRSPISLVTSDNPVILVPIHTPDGHVAVPLSPTKLFVATRNRPVRDAVLKAPPNATVRLSNRLLVERADRYVIATNDAQDRFIRRYIGTCRIGSFATGFNQPDRPGARRV